MYSAVIFLIKPAAFCVVYFHQFAVVLLYLRLMMMLIYIWNVFNRIKLSVGSLHQTCKIRCKYAAIAYMTLYLQGTVLGI